MSVLLPRSAYTQLADYVTDFRVVIVNGPRQAGKTTLLELFQERHGGVYQSLDNTELRQAAIADPVAFVDSDARPLIIDEVQRGGDPLILEIKGAVDRNQSSGQFILAGSSSFLTVPILSESLAGRAALIDLWPFSVAERTGDGGSVIDRIFNRPESFSGISSTWTRGEYLELICAGGYPSAVRMTNAASRRKWFGSYLRTVIARDLADFTRVQDAQAILRLLGVAAARHGSPFVYSDVARGLGVDHKTAQQYLSYLSTVFLVAQVPVWSTNITTRLTKAAEVFLTDSGLAAHVTGAEPAALAKPGNRTLGGLTECFVFTELLKLRGLTGDAFQIYHYRDRDQREIDFICESLDGRVAAIEVKASSSPRSEDARTLRWLRDKLGGQLTAGIVLHMGTESVSYGDRIYALPLSALWNHTRLPTHR